LQRHLKDNPSLHARLDEFITDSYIDSVLLAAKETGLDESSLLDECPYAQDDLLNSDFSGIMTNDLNSIEDKWKAR
jgi:hypothetical protein